MARPRDDRRKLAQLTLADWEREQEEDRRRREEATPPSEGPSIDAVAGLVDALVPRLAAELAGRTPAGAVHESATARLVTLDQLVAELPPAKKPETWKRWLYERTRRGEVPGEVKIGGMLFFEREPALAWLRAGATRR
ncbi:MAG: hypothetical protein WD027_07675 [Gaiellales bacterium]